MLESVTEAGASEVDFHSTTGFLTSRWEGGRLKSEDYVVSRNEVGLARRKRQWLGDS